MSTRIHNEFDSFIPNRLSTLRHANKLSLDEIALKLEISKQSIHLFETGQREPSKSHIEQLSILFGVKTDFFYKTKQLSDIPLDKVHFRKLKSTPISLKKTTVSKLELINFIIENLENYVNLPKINIPYIVNEHIENIALQAREHWKLGLGPISNVTLLAESNGAFILEMTDIDTKVDALSVFKADQRPLILRNTSKESPCRNRFDIVHEIGHLIMHRFIETGDNLTESEANSFSAAFLLPKEIMLTDFSRYIFRRSQINWEFLSEFKLEWKVSKAAILYRAHKLNIISDAQYKSAVISLKRKGEAITEKEDYLIQQEKPMLISQCIDLLTPDLLNQLLNDISMNKSAFYELINKDYNHVIQFK